MRRAKLHYNADRWWAYCADRMGWQVGHWIDKFYGTKAGTAVGSVAGQQAPVQAAIRSHDVGVSAGSADAASSPTFNGNAADATQANTHPSRVCADAAAPTPQVWRTRK